MTKITIDRSVAEQALEALETVFMPFHPAVIALRAALAEHYCDTHCTWADHAPGCVKAEPVQENIMGNSQDFNEPVAWVYTGIKQDGTEHGPHLVWKPTYMDAMSADKGAKATPLYTAPPQRKPLTEEEIDKLEWATSYENPMTLREGLQLFARALERAHGIGGTDD